MAWGHFIIPIMRHFRRRRMARFAASIPDLPSMTVLDVGGRPFLWDLLAEEYGVRPRRVVMVNMEALPPHDELVRVAGDGCRLPFRDDSFDLVFSNSVIEHVGDLPEMGEFARECVRVGRSYWIQTPNRWFPVEPHLVTVFLHFLPRRLYRALAFLSLRRVSLLGRGEVFYRIFDTCRLLDRGELEGLFPGARIFGERALGLVKSWTVTNISA